MVKKEKRRKSKFAPNYFIIGAIITAVIIGAFFLRGKNSVGNLTPVDSFDHLHGLMVRPDGDVYIATHTGLYLLRNDKDLYRIGSVRDDLMGSSMHPKDPNKVYASGHPARGGNLGVVVSEDGGVNWKQIFRGLGGEAVDFHAMALSNADPNILYGWHSNRLYVTQDGGKTWRFANAKGLSNVVTLAADTKMSNKVYAGAYLGLYLSEDRGETWSLRSNVGFVGGIAVDPRDNNAIYAFTEQHGMAKSQDGGASWLAIADGISIRPPEAILYVAIHPQNSNVIYAGTTANKIFKSENGGSMWSRLR